MQLMIIVVTESDQQFLAVLLRLMKVWRKGGEEFLQILETHRQILNTPQPAYSKQSQVETRHNTLLHFMNVIAASYAMEWWNDVQARVLSLST